MTGAPVLLGGLASVDCELEEAIERHSHAIVLGRVRAVTVGEGSSLVYAAGRYGASSPEGDRPWPARSASTPST